MIKEHYDLVILGAGPAGLAAARAARSMALSVALIERHRLGGNSLNAGSIPSKAWVGTGRAFDAIARAEQFGAPPLETPLPNMDRVQKRMHRIRERISTYCSVEQLKSEGIDIFFGTACFEDRSSIRVGSLQLRFKKALIATGALPRVCDIPGLQAAGCLTSANVFETAALPRRLGIIGGGPLGCEMAQAFARLGTRVTILQNEPKFLPREERDAAQLLSLALSRSGVDTRLNTWVVGAGKNNGAKWIRAINSGNEYSLEVDEILVSIGRSANTEDLSLGKAGIDCGTDMLIHTDELLCTANGNVYAAGDVCMQHQFTNIAEASGRMAVQNAFASGITRRSDMIVPWCTYCDPEIAHVGMQMWEARRQAILVKSYTVMMQDVDRAITDGRDEGFVKIHVREGTDEIMGATIVGSRASEMINEISVLMHAKIGMRQLAGILHTYPTQSDAIRLAALAYIDANASHSSS